MKKRLMIIDGNSVIYRAYFALPPMNNGKGLETNALYGFTSMMFKMIQDYKPTHFCVAFDKSSKTFRHEDYEKYKAGRAKMDDELRMQLTPLREMLDAFQIKRYEIENYEADDIIGTISKEAEKEDYEIFVVTGDKDALQLASDKTTILFTVKGISNIDAYDSEGVIERYSLTPEQFVDLKALMGDSSDNLPGVKGIGEKTGIKLLTQFSSIEGIYDNIDQIKGKQKENLLNDKDMAFLCKKLATIYRDVPIEFNIEDMTLGGFDRQEVVNKFKEFAFNTLTKRFLKLDDELKLSEQTGVSEPYNTKEIENKTEEDKHQEQTSTNDTISSSGSKRVKLESIDDIDRDEMKKILKDIDSLYLKIAVKEGNILDKRILKVYFSPDSKNIYSISGDDIEQLKEVLEDEKVKKYGYEIKSDYISLLAYDIHMKNMNFDIAIAEYILDSKAQTAYTFDSIGFKYADINVKSEEDVLGKGAKKKDFSDLEEDDLNEYFKNIISVVVGVLPIMKLRIEDLKIEELFYDIEMALVEVLGDMEYYGIKVDKAMLDELGANFTDIIEKLKSDMYEMAGRSFNVNSPKQVGEVFFEELKLPVIKKTKTGYSTNIEVLEKLRDEHPIVEKLIEYRTIAKLNSTYVEGLKGLINEKDGRIHSNFNQTITTTGRISSTDPNMQNIPVRTEEGRNLRKVFVSEDGTKLVDADYSQVELRVLAHMSEDENMIHAFEEKEDIHRTTASKVFGVNFDDVTSEMRSAAKAVNFGIIYGKTDYGLSKDLDIPVADAKKYIDSYFEKYPKIRAFMDGIISDAKKTGYVETILHRRRYIPEILSKRFLERNRGIRAAMNAPIQGSAADIIKIAMVNVHKKLKEEKLKAKLILQVHDELILEVDESDVDKARELLKNEMERAVSLKVNLDVDVNVGNSWFETK